MQDATIYLAGGGHQITVEFTDTGYMDQLRIAYSGPDTLRKPTQLPYEQRDDILYMGQPPIVATPKSTTTKMISSTQEIFNFSRWRMVFLKAIFFNFQKDKLFEFLT